jgi:hypothetical protein
MQTLNKIRTDLLAVVAINPKPEKKITRPPLNYHKISRRKRTYYV